MIVHIGEGIYREKLVINRPNVTFEGAGTDKTILVYGDAAFDLMPDGDKRGTFRTASVRIDTHDFTAKHLTFQNDSGFGHTVGQALAVYVDGDRNAFYDCRFLGSQDTIFDAPLPLKEAQPGGFKGPGEFKPRTIGRHYYENCFIQGDVDFIFGSGIAWFEHCTIYSKLPGDRIPPESPEDEVIYGYVTAASTPMEEPYGYVFHECSLESDCPPRSIYLDVPGENGQRPYSCTVNWGNTSIPPAGRTGRNPMVISITENMLPTVPALPLTPAQTSPTS